MPSPVVYASPRIDVTDQVLERLKREHGSKGGDTMSLKRASYSLGEIAARFGLELRGDAVDADPRRLDTGRGLAADQIGFLANPRYRSQLATTAAGAVIVNAQDANEAGQPE